MEMLQGLVAQRLAFLFPEEKVPGSSPGEVDDIFLVVWVTCVRSWAVLAIADVAYESIQLNSFWVCDYALR